MENAYQDRNWTSIDGLDLYFRDYPAQNGGNGRPPIICMHGLTRNSRDFADFAARLAGEWRVIVPEMRGRGHSEYASDSATYTPLQYVADIDALLEQEEIGRFVAIGTSLGGLMTMLLAMRNPDCIAGAVLNDIGPEIDTSGIERIRDYVGQPRNFDTWMHAARELQEIHGAAFPAYDIEQWLGMAKRGLTVQENGRIGFDYDMKIAEPFAQDDGAAPPNLWPAYQALDGRPVLILRGALSDLLSDATLERMVDTVSDARAVTVANVGHAPMLSEAESVTAIDELLSRIS